MLEQLGSTGAFSNQFIEGMKQPCELEPLIKINLKTAVGPCKKVQDFDSESLDAGVEHFQKVKATPASRDSGSKDCAFLPASTAVFRMICHFAKNRTNE